MADKLHEYNEIKKSLPPGKRFSVASVQEYLHRYGYRVGGGTIRTYVRIVQGLKERAVEMIKEMCEKDEKPVISITKLHSASKAFFHATDSIQCGALYRIAKAKSGDLDKAADIADAVRRAVEVAKEKIDALCDRESYTCPPDWDRQARLWIEHSTTLDAEAMTMDDMPAALTTYINHWIKREKTKLGPVPPAAPTTRLENEQAGQDDDWDDGAADAAQGAGADAHRADGEPTSADAADQAAEPQVSLERVRDTPFSGEPDIPPLSTNISFHCADWGSFYSANKEKLDNKIDLQIHDPPYQILSTARDVIMREEMRDLAEASMSMATTTGIVVIFCSFAQFTSWVQVLSDAGWRVQRVPLTVIRSPRVQYSRSKSKTMICNVQLAVVASRQQLDLKAIEERGPCPLITREQKNEFGPTCNVISNYFPPQKKLRIERDGALQVVRTEEKSVDLYLELIWRYMTGADPHVVDFYAGTAASALAAMELGVKWTGCERDAECYRPALDRLEDVHRSAFTTRYSAALQRAQVEALGSVSSRVFTEEDALDCRELIRLLSEKVIPSLPKDISPVVVNPMESSSTPWTTEVQRLKLGVQVGTSRIPGAGLGVFATEAFAEGATVCHYWGRWTLLQEAVRGPRKRVVELVNLFDQTKQVRLQTAIPKLAIVASLACTAYYINSCVGTAQQSNVDYFESEDAVQVLGDSRSTWTYVEIRATSDIRVGDELLASYDWAALEDAS